MAGKNASVLEKYPGQLFFGAVLGACLLLSLISVAMEGGQKGDIDTTAAAGAKLKKRLKSREIVPGPPSSALLADEKKLWETAPEAPEQRDWAFARRPVVRVEVEKKEDTRKILAPPEITGLTESKYEVRVTWKDGATTTAKIKGYNVYRWTKGGALGKPINERGPLAPGKKEFTDSDFTTLKPLAEVFYAVTALTDEETRTEKKESDPSETSTITLPDDRVILYYGRKGVEFAYVVVKRFHGGSDVTQNFQTYLGDPVGRLAKAEVNDEDVEIDFTTTYLLTYIGEEMRKVVKTKLVQLRDEKGRPQFDENGNPIMVEEKSERMMSVKYIEVVDGAGKVMRIDATDEPSRKPKEPKNPGPNVDALTTLIYKLELDRYNLLVAGAKGARDQLRRLKHRIDFLKKGRRNIMTRDGKVNEDKLFAEGGYLYKFRWDYLKLNDKVKKKGARATKQDRDKVIKLEDIIRDLESLLSPEGKKKEEQEWQRDRDEFENK